MFEHDYLGGGFTKWVCTNALCNKQVGELRKLLAAGRALAILSMTFHRPALLFKAGSLKLSYQSLPEVGGNGNQNALGWSLCLNLHHICDACSGGRV
jgi:hypothetical protein